jgi:hypothetical protein
MSNAISEAAHPRDDVAGGTRSAPVGAAEASVPGRLGFDRPSEQPTAVARAYAQIAGELPERVARQLMAILEHRLAAPRGTLRQEASLGLWKRVFLAQGRIPVPAEYDAAYSEARARGELWPSRTTLQRYYGGFQEVNAAGVRWLRLGGAGRVPGSFAHGKDRPEPETYASPKAIAEAIAEFYERWDYWPYAQEYFDWVSQEAWAARLLGHGVPVRPSRGPIRSAFPSFEAAVAFAQQEYNKQ